MKNNLSVWTWSAGWRYYLRRPWKWFKELYWNVKYAWRRSTKGYCFLDYTNFSEWFCQIAPSMLRDIADKGWGYPGVEPFDEPEKWHDWLHKMADQLEWCSETWREENKINEYYQPYMDEIEKTLKEHDSLDWLGYSSEKEKELMSKYYDREMELYDESQKKLTETLTEMTEHWWRLWD